MSTFTLKSIARRSTMLVAAGALVVATFAPAAVFADALNPLTERSLLLSSSAPGWQDTDGSGYSTTNPNPGAGVGIPGTYAPAGAGANGMKTGETFSFKISTAATPTRPIKAFSLQYCTSAAGNCQAPGDNTGDARNSDRQTNATALASKKSDFDANLNTANPVGGVDYKILVGGTEIANYSDWSLGTMNVEDGAHSGTLTGKRNYITVSSPTGITAAAANTKVQIIFVASETHYITNPGSGSFFVKMNTWDTNVPGAPTPGVGGANFVPGGAANIDGGVTVANVMADSIHITTKVLETMSFSVGTDNPDAENYLIPAGEPNEGDPDAGRHGSCDIITANNRIELGNVDAERSLATDRGYGANSFWRLSSNSSGGATVYYSGETLTNTVGDKIKPIGTAPNTKTLSNPGTEQFGLAFDMTGVGNKKIDAAEYSASFTAAVALLAPYTPGLNVLDKTAAYADGHGSLGIKGGPAPVSATAQFAFDVNSVKNPVAIADNTVGGGVLGCETGKMRYVANIAPDTPAGVYTTKINYLAAPQY